MFSAKPDRDEAPARARARARSPVPVPVPVPDAETHANLDHLDDHLEEDDDEDDGENHRTLPALSARDAPASPEMPGSRVREDASTTALVEDDDAVDGLVAALETCVESLAGNDEDEDADADAAALGAAADLLEDQGVAFAEAHMLEWTARLMRRGKSLATRHPERWRVHYERAWRGVAAAVAREYDGATLSLDEGDGNRAPRGKGKITIGPKVGGTQMRTC